MRGDPAKIARVLVELASNPKPPLRLLIGTDAVFMAGMLAEARAQEDAQWRSVSVSTDFDGLVDFAQTPVAQMLKEKRS
jgi:hypothetical protein